MGAVKIRSIFKTFGAVRVLDGIDLDIAEGEFLTLLGASGSGKTTLLQILAGFVRPTSGSVLVDGQELLTKPPHKRNVGMVFQNYALFPNMDVRGNVAYPLKVRGVKGAELKARAEKALATVQLDHLADRRVDQLSGGQKQRVALARAIVFEPSILLMDEPLSALDQKLREQMRVELRRLHDRLGTTTVFVTHDQREALSISDRIAVLNAGRMAQIDRPADLYERPRTKFVADFIGETVFVPVEADGRGARQVLGQPLLSTVEGAGGPGWLVLRPEKLVVVSGERAGWNLFDAVVRDVAFHGDSLLLTARLANGAEVAARAPAQGGVGASLPGPGQPVRLGLHPCDAVVVADD